MPRCPGQGSRRLRPRLKTGRNNSIRLQSVRLSATKAMGQEVSTQDSCRGARIFRPSALSCDGLYSAGCQLDDTGGHQFVAQRIDLELAQSGYFWGCGSRYVSRRAQLSRGCGLDRPHPFASLRDSPGRARSSIGQSIGLRIRGLGVRLPSGAPMKLHSAGTLSAPIHASLYVSAVRVGPDSGLSCLVSSA
jgi:hypothetical protein